MNKKIRLVGGPLGGKVVDDPYLYGKNEVVMRGPKKMTRKQQYDWMRGDNMDKYHLYSANIQDNLYPQKSAMPQVEARYRISIHPHAFVTNGSIPCMHPDGSIFYEYVEGSKREFN